MRAALDDLAVLQDQDLVGGADRREAVRDDQGRAARQCVRQCFADRGLGLGVQVRGRLVEDDDLGLREQQPRDGQPLALTAGKPVPALPTVVSRPSGRECTSSPSRARSRASQISSSVTSGRA